MADYGLKDERYTMDLLPYCSHEVIAMKKNMEYMPGMGFGREGKGEIFFNEKLTFQEKLVVVIKEVQEEVDWVDYMYAEAMETMLKMEEDVFAITNEEPSDPSTFIGPTLTTLTHSQSRRWPNCPTSHRWPNQSSLVQALTLILTTGPSSHRQSKLSQPSQAVTASQSKGFCGFLEFAKSHLPSIGRCPRLKFKDVMDMRQQVLIRQQNKVDGTMSLNVYQFDQVKVRNNLARMVILHEYPLSMVDYIGFREFVSSLQPLFKLISRNTLKSDILKIYDNEREKTLKMMDKNGKWNIDRKLSTIIVDDCSTNDVMIRLFLNKFDTSSLMLSGSKLYMRCAAHILNLIVQDELSLIGDGIERIRDSVIYWTGPPKRRQKFDENACQLSVQRTKELVLD
ncbi:hypothetical protein SO802_029212 [Lithocarpus litseifolius]|uniref:G-patch domain-containing protein n=1 Tax=Lithocarpus litseifolius TaxID=425828 RepID=A0AAW2BTI0_9ROSI